MGEDMSQFDPIASPTQRVPDNLALSWEVHLHHIFTPADHACAADLIRDLIATSGVVVLS
jgi:hypothetical protein